MLAWQVNIILDPLHKSHVSNYHGFLWALYILQQHILNTCTLWGTEPTCFHVWYIACCAHFIIYSASALLSLTSEHQLTALHMSLAQIADLLMWHPSRLINTSLQKIKCLLQNNSKCATHKTDFTCWRIQMVIVVINRNLERKWTCRESDRQRADHRLISPGQACRGMRSSLLDGDEWRVVIRSCHAAVSSLQSELETGSERKTGKVNKDSSLSVKARKQQGEERWKKRERAIHYQWDTQKKKDARAEKK